MSGRHVDGTDPADVEAPAGEAVETTHHADRPDEEERPTVVVVIIRVRR